MQVGQSDPGTMCSDGGMCRLRTHDLLRSFAFAAVAACAMMGGASNANAEEISNVKSVEMAVQGHIAERCAMGSSATSELGDLTRPGITAAAQFQLECNLPFIMSIKARNGALAHATMPTGQGGYAGSVPYSLDVELPVRRPTPEMISKVFDGHALTGGQDISSRGGIATDGLLLKLSLGDPGGGAGLLAGNYSEIIEITISPS